MIVQYMAIHKTIAVLLALAPRVGSFISALTDGTKKPTPLANNIVQKEEPSWPGVLKWNDHFSAGPWETASKQIIGMRNTVAITAIRPDVFDKGHHATGIIPQPTHTMHV
jgi:hypothetical protein